MEMRDFWCGTEGSVELRDFGVELKVFCDELRDFGC